MSISAALHGVIDALLPQDCLLCAADAGPEILCPDCRDSLPNLTGERCPVCAQPTPQSQVCGACLKSSPAFDGTLVVWRYAFPVDKLIQTLKFEHRLALAGFFARRMLAGERPPGDVIVPLPLSAHRLRERGFNQAVEIARPLARALGLPLDTQGVLRRLDTGPQSRLPWKERRRNVRGAFEGRTDYTGKTVIAVDDVMTTGATLDEFARTLKKHGAKSVVNWVTARALKS